MSIESIGALCFRTNKNELNYEEIMYCQCGAFTGIIPVLALFLIKLEWYWYLVFEVVFEVF